jgi:hypothetical protein
LKVANLAHFFRKKAKKQKSKKAKNKKAKKQKSKKQKTKMGIANFLMDVQKTFARRQRKY